MLLGACPMGEPLPDMEYDGSTPAVECNWRAIGSTDRRIRYQAASVRSDAACVKQDQVRTCKAGGRWSRWSGDYSFEFCDCAVLERASAWASAAWPKIDFAAQRAHFTAYAALRQDADGITAILGNAGEAPDLQWTVNGNPVAQSGVQLSATQYAKGVELPRFGGQVLYAASCSDFKFNFNSNSIGLT